MKLQFDAGGARLRVSRAELAALRSGSPLEVDLHWPDALWGLTVRSGEALHVRQAAGRIVLVVPATDLGSLAERLPAREGLRYVLDRPSGPLQLRLEVDLHDGRARAR